MLTKEQYISKLTSQRKRYRRTIRSLLLTALFVFASLSIIVRFGFLIGIPVSVSQYMFKTLFYNFSQSQLQQLLLTGTGNDALLPCLLAIYWGHHALAILIILLFVVSQVKEHTLERYKAGLLASEDLLKSVRSYMMNPSGLNRFRLLIVVARSSLYSYICPLRRRWFRHPEYQWFSWSAIDRDVRGIVASLAEFKTSLSETVRSGLNLQAYLKPIELLQDFFFSVASRTDKNLRSLTQDLSSVGQPEVKIIQAFSKDIRPLIMAAARSRKQEPPPSPIVSWLACVTESRLVRTAAVVSSIAAAVMVIGVVVFKIDASQAFITWFTVSFGSLSISVGVSVFSSLKEHVNSSNEH